MLQITRILYLLICQKFYIFSTFLNNKLAIFFQTERRYGCYRLGILVAFVIVLVLILGTIPATLTIRNNKIVLACLCITLATVTILVLLFIIWQQRQARRQRERYGRPYVLQVHNQVKYEMHGWHLHRSKWYHQLINTYYSFNNLFYFTLLER